MSKRVFVERHNGRVVRLRGRFSGHGGDRANRTLRSEERAERRSAKQELVRLLPAIDEEDLVSLTTSDERFGDSSALAAQARERFSADFDDDFYLDASFDESTGKLSFASCGRRRR